MRRKSGFPCSRCGGQMFFEPDLMHRHIACKCLQCGYISAYLWIEPGESKPQYELAGRISDGSVLADD